MIYYQDREYISFEKLDIFGGILDLDNGKGGGYFTHFAVSPIEYRKKNPTKAKFEVDKENEKITISITNDWGKKNIITITDESISDPVLIEALKKFEQQNKELSFPEL